VSCASAQNRSGVAGLLISNATPAWARDAEPPPATTAFALFGRRAAGQASRMAENNGNGRSGDAERYRQAATDALSMLDWCIGYLVGTRKESIAAQMARNRAHIRRDLMHEPEEPVPTTKG
jgi:hypothetical protein